MPFEPEDAWIKLKITAPPEDGKANKAIIAHLAKALSVPPSAIAIMSGETSRLKRIRIETPSPDLLLNRLAARVQAEAGHCFSIRQ